MDHSKYRLNWDSYIQFLLQNVNNCLFTICLSNGCTFSLRIFQFILSCHIFNQLWKQKLKCWMTWFFFLQWISSAKKLKAFYASSFMNSLDNDKQVFQKISSFRIITFCIRINRIIHVSTRTTRIWRVISHFHPSRHISHIFNLMFANGYYPLMCSLSNKYSTIYVKNIRFRKPISTKGRSALITNLTKL